MHVCGISLYSLIEDFFTIWRLIKDVKSNIVFSASFDYDIYIYILYLEIDSFLVHKYVESSVPVFSAFIILHPKRCVKFILRLSKVSDQRI